MRWVMSILFVLAGLCMIRFRDRVSRQSAERQAMFGLDFEIVLATARVTTVILGLMLIGMGLAGLIVQVSVLRSAH